MVAFFAATWLAPLCAMAAIVPICDGDAVSAWGPVVQAVRAADAVPTDDCRATPFNDEHEPHVAAMCEQIWKRNQDHGLPYGFRYDVSSFRRDGTMVPGPNERGFTCATFVLAVFRTVGVELLQREEWPPRADDQERFEKLLKLLRKHCTDEVHINAVRAETNSIRYQPLEVAGGSRYAPLASFVQASESANQIRNSVAPSEAAGTDQP